MNMTQTVCDLCKGDVECKNCEHWKEDYYYPDLLHYDGTSFFDKMNHDQRQALRKEGY